MTTRFDKSRLPSRHVSVGPERAPHRSYYYAMGLTEEEIARPFVGIASAGNDSAPCNTTLDAQADICRRGVEEGGGMPRRFNTITVTDGIAMGHQGMKSSLVSREVIADSVELSVRGHCYDALVTFAGCDKSLPGMMMAMLRLNVPSIFVYGGSILPGRFHDRDVTVVDVFEAVGRYAAKDDSCPLSELIALEKVACPGHGACGGQFTANTMACVGEAIGLSLPNSNMAPAPYKSREDIAVAAGRQVMALLERNLRPRDICTRSAFENAARGVAATGGVVGLKGTLAPEGAIVKVAGMKRLQFSGPARVFDCEEDAFEAVENRQIAEGCVVVIRYEGPKGGPGMREMLSPTSALIGKGLGESVGLITQE